MSSSPGQSSNKVHAFALRPVAIFLTFCLMLFAMAQGFGRLTFSAIHVFETQINSALEFVDVSLDGIKGDWHGLNPVLRIRQVNFPTGTAQGVEVELDLLESVWRSNIIARRAYADEVVLHADQAGRSWRLRGLTEGGTSFDVWPMLDHVDDLAMQVRLRLHPREGEAQEVGGKISLINQGDSHYARIDVANASYPEQQLSGQLWRSPAQLRGEQASNTLRLDGAIAIPDALTGMSSLIVHADDGTWFDRDETGDGLLQLRVTGVQAPGANAVLQAGVLMKIQRQGDIFKVIASLQAEADTSSLLAAQDAQSEHIDDALSLGPMLVTVDLAAHSSGLANAAQLLGVTERRLDVQLWLPELRLDSVSNFFAAHMGNWEPAGRWIRALDVRGTIRNVQAYFDREHGLGYVAKVEDVRMQGYRGAPTADRISGQLWGNQRIIALHVNSPEMAIHFPSLYDEGWQVTDVSATIKAWVRPGYFGMKGSDIQASLLSDSKGDSNGGSRVGGSFALSRPNARHEQRLSLHLFADQVDLDIGKTFIPKKIPQTLADWIDRGPRAATLSNPRFAYHGQIHLREGELARRLEFLTSVRDGHVQYDERWPSVMDFQGIIHVAGLQTRIDLASGQSRAVQFGPSRVVLYDNGAYAVADIHADTNALAALDFVRKSPLIENLSFITPQWTGSGALQVRGNLVVPINRDKSPDLNVDIDFETTKVALHMPNYRLGFDELVGTGHFSLPHNLRGDFSGRLFGNPASITTDFDADWLRFSINGKAAPEDVYQILEFTGSVPAQGSFNFDSVLSIAMDDGITNMAVFTDLKDLAVSLPAQFGKTVGSIVPTELDVQFLPDYASVRLKHGNVQGWLHYDEEIARGALGINGPTPMTAQDQKAILVSGSLPELVLGDWVGPDSSGDGAGVGERAGFSLPVDWVIQGLAVERFIIDELVFPDMRLSGNQQGQDLAFEFDSPDLRGTVAMPADAPMKIDVAYIKLPGNEADSIDSVDEVVDPFAVAASAVDPLSADVGRSLPAASVVIQQLDLGDEPFGNWRFDIVPSNLAVGFHNFSADVNGVHIDGAQIIWNLLDHRSAFEGRVNLDDLEQTLPLWDYAPSLTTDRAWLNADVAWTGSPVNVSLLETSGTLDFDARDGRFRDVETGQGGLRILSLMNFSKITKRINFDFSDVVGDGISFDKVKAKISLDAGQLVFSEPMVVDSSSGNFQVGGHVDLRSGALDNEMIVTLPLSKSLPWYGVYIALVNPLAGIGVVIGERVLRKPLEQFSTAKYAVTGTLDDPKVDFVTLWDRSMKAPLETIPQASATELEGPVEVEVAIESPAKSG